MSTPTKVRQHEDELTELLAVTLNLYLTKIISKDAYLQYVRNLLTAAADETQHLVDKDNREQSDELIATFAMEQAYSDVLDQLDDLEAGESVESIRTRLNETAQWLPWRTYSETQRNTAKKQGKLLQWFTQLDERVCPLCAPLHGQTFTPSEAPQQPLHARCRCFYTIV